MVLPFLEEHSFPTSRDSKTRTISDSGEDTTLLHEGLLDEFLRAYEQKDAKSLREAFQAIVRMIKMKESDETSS